MIDDSPQAHLTALKNALSLLKTYPLPVETRLTVLKAIQHAERLNDYLVENPEQTRLAALYEVSQVLGRSLDLDEVLNQVMDAVIQLTRAERGFLVLVDSDTGSLSLRAARNIERESLEHKDMEVSRTVIQTVVNEGEGVVTTDAQTDPRFAGQESVIIFSLRSILCAPLRARGQIIGVIYVENRAQSGIFTERDLEMLNAFATQAAIAIENARLYTRTDRALNERVIELETLTKIDRQLNAQLELKRVVEITHRWAKTGTQADQSWIILFEGGELEALGEDGLSIPFPEGKELNDVCQNVIASKQPEVFPGDEENRFRIASPIVMAGKSVGALIVDRNTPFATTAVQFLERLTARASAAIGNARLYQEVQQANEAKTKFISVVTHELRIPMTSIRGYTDLLKAGAVGSTNEQQQNFLEIINNNIDRMSALVSDLADISRIETGRLNLHLELISLSDYVRETIGSLAPKLEEKNHHLEINLPDSLPFVYADSNRVVQILSNLISNAWKYTPPEGHITIMARVQNHFLHIEVCDNGIGISQEDQTYLFTQFFRSEDQTVRDQQGWGLGLDVTKRLVNLMGGEIGVSSKLGEGSTFWFTLPTSAPEGTA